jgi:hypothetical protein
MSVMGFRGSKDKLAIHERCERLGKALPRAPFPEPPGC